jgi:ribosomal protein L7/L12
VNTALFLSLAISALLFVLVVRSGSPGPEPAPASPRARADLEVDLARCLAEGRKIEAIKLYRRIHGVGLREAKEAVERLEAEAPATP